MKKLTFIFILFLGMTEIFGQQVDPLREEQYYLSVMQIENLWEITEGDSNVVIAVIDRGIWIEHPDLSENIFVNYMEIPNNGIDDDNNGYIDDVSGWDVIDGDGNVSPESEESNYSFYSHGQEVAGVIGAIKDNGIGLAGIAPGCKVLPIRFDASGENNKSDLPISEEEIQRLLSAIDYIEELNAQYPEKRFIINMSMGWSSTYQPEILLDKFQEASTQNILIFAAAGNNRVTLFPACAEYVYAVTGVDENDEYFYRAPGLFAASSEQIVSTIIDDPYYTTTFNATSSASPIAAGIAALLLSIAPDLTNQRVIECMSNSCDKVDPEDAEYDENGFSAKLGYGRLNAYNAYINNIVNITFENRIEDRTGETLYVEGVERNSGYNANYIIGDSINLQISEDHFYSNAGELCKFYKWKDEYQLDDVRDHSFLYSVEGDEYNVVSANFHKTKPLTVMNYFEGETGKEITFGEIDYNVKSHNSPYNDDVFIYNPPDVDATYQATASPVHTNFDGTNWTFIRWENGNTNTTRTEAVTEATSPIWKAMYKASLRSDNQSAFANNNQRKMIRTANGNLFLTYESMNQVWLEMSTDNGRTWDLIDPNESDFNRHSPSLVLSGKDGRTIYLLMQDDAHNEIEIWEFDQDGNFQRNTSTMQAQETPANSTPVGVSTKDGDLIIYFVNNSSDPGIYYYSLKNNNGVLTFADFGKVTGTTSSSVKPTAAINPKSGKGKAIRYNTYLAWQEGNSIKYKKLDFGPDLRTDQASSTIETPSYRSGYMQNTDPSIAYANGMVVLAWHGYKKVVSAIGGETKATTIYHNIVVRERASINWGQFLVYGNNAFKPSISSNYAGDDYYVTWSEHPAQSKYVVGSDNHINGFFSTSTNYVQSYNINDMKNIQGMSFEDSSSPYEFLTAVDAPPSKDDANAYYAGREGVVRKDSAEFYFAVGDVLLDGKTVDFKPLLDTLAIDSLTALNKYLETEPIELNSNSDFQYSVIFGVTDDTTAAIVLGDNDNINFTVRLIDASSGEVIGSYDNVTFTKTEAGQYKNIAYKVNTEGMSSRTVKLQIRISDNLASPEYGLAKIYSSETLLNKPATEEIPLEGTLAVTKYELAQNYPNPFNPATTIRFSVPNERGKTANVNLSVYNVLGQRVTELVNKALPSGNYEVKFNASGLSSGVYYYRLRSGNFVETKKMILLK